MTLFRQIFVLVSAIFLALLLALEATYVHHARQYVQEQLGSHAQDVATSLGLVLPLSLKDGDVGRAETTVDAVFERGYYREIRVVSMDGRTLMVRSLPPDPPEVPAWFVALVPVHAPSAQSLITTGWRQLGRVIVQSHPNFAYLQLWSTTRAATELLAGTWLVSLLLLWFFLRTILRPLREIEDVARDIGERRFTTVQVVPSARELRRVVDAINTLSGKIRDAIGAEIAAAQRWRAEAYRDPLTGFDNRRSFVHRLEQSLHARGGQAAALYVVQLTGLEALNAAHGVERGDALIKQVAEALHDLEAGDGTVHARLGGSTFGVLCWRLDHAGARDFGDRIEHAVAAALEAAEEREIGHAVGAVYAPRNAEGVTALLGEADVGVRQALERGGSQPVVMVEHGGGALASEEGARSKALILDALQAGRIALWMQPVFAFGDGPPRVLQQEMTGSLVDDKGEPVPAARFLPVALRYGLTPELDRSFLGEIFKRLQQGGIEGQVAVNLAARSLRDPALVARVVELLQQSPELARRIVFEFPEFGVVQELARVSEFAAQVRPLGAGVAIDNFGFDPAAFHCLQTLRPSYVKLATSFLQDIESHAENQFFIASVVRVARPLDILTVVCGVEDSSRLALLRDLGVDGYQGWAMARPVAIA